MLHLADDLLPLLRAGARVAAVTVTDVVRSAPHGIGATMAVTADGRVIGSISGGCVESDAIALAHLATATGAIHRARFGFSDESAHAAGLACGGEVDVAAYPVPTDAATLSALEDAAAGRPAVLAVGDLVLTTPRRPRLVIVGAGEHAAALCRVAAASGFSVTVCDVWDTLATPARFPDAAEVVVADPPEWLAGLDADEDTAVCILTHDERVDVPSIAAALALPVGFIGAMGARGTVVHRLRMLRERGISDVDLERLHSPLGLDLGGASPAETAISVLAEIVSVRHGGSALPLRDLEGPLHARIPQAASCTRGAS